MALTFGFFDSVNGDRKYNARDFGRLFNGIITDGIFANIGEHLNVTPTEPPSMAVVIGTGRAWINGTWANNDTPYTYSLPAPPVDGFQLYSLFLTKNSNLDARNIKFELVKHPLPNDETPYTSVEDNIQRLLLCTIKLKAGVKTVPVTAIRQNNSQYITAPLASENLKDILNVFRKEFDSILKEKLNTLIEWYSGGNLLATDMDSAAFIAFKKYINLVMVEELANSYTAVLDSDHFVIESDTCKKESKFSEKSDGSIVIVEDVIDKASNFKVTTETTVKYNKDTKLYEISKKGVSNGGS